MKKIIALLGSPNQNGRTATLVKEVVKGAAQSGAVAKIYHLNSMNIGFCQGCKSCRKVGHTCALQDDMQEVYKDFMEADAVVLGSPIYVHQISAQMKVLFDRLSALLDDKLKPEFTPKDTVMIYTQGNANPKKFQNYFQVNANFMNEFGLKVVDTFVFAGYDEDVREELLQRAYLTGETLVRK